MGFVVEFYHLYCLLCMWTLCCADSKVEVWVAFLVTNILVQCVMLMISHYWLQLLPHWNQWSQYVKNLVKNLISLPMQVKPFVYTFLGNNVILKIHPNYIWMTKPCPGIKTYSTLGTLWRETWKKSRKLLRKDAVLLAGVNCLLANFKSVQKEILPRVFLSQCCHMYGSLACALDACPINSFCSTWHKVIHTLRRLPYIARSAPVPHLIKAPPIEDQLYQRTANNVLWYLKKVKTLSYYYRYNWASMLTRWGSWVTTPGS